MIANADCRLGTLLLVVVINVGWVSRSRAGESLPPGIGNDLQSFVVDHCLDCHSGDSAAGNLDLENLAEQTNPLGLSDLESMRRWTRVHDRVAAAEMPPPDSQPIDPTVRRNFVAQLSDTLIRADQMQNDVVLRRLNRSEYENTVRDLFGITHLDIRSLLPSDNSAAGFDNVGDGLAYSPEAAAAYLRAADAAIDAVLGPDQPPQRIVHRTNLRDQKTHDGKPALAKQIGKMFRQTDRGLVIFQSGYCPTNLVEFARLRAPQGTYRVSLQVRAIQSTTPVTLRIYGGDTIVSRREKHLVGYFDVPPDEWTTIEFEDRLVEPGGTFQPKCYGTKDTRKDADTYPEPGIEIGDITIEGPLEAWPPPSRSRLYGDIDLATAGLAEIQQIFQRLMPRALRRPLATGEMQPYLSLCETALADGRSFDDALRIGLKGILCSPQFLYLDEPTEPQTEEVIDSYALASRLSYFLWSSMPDDELLSLARQGTIAEPAVLHRQVERMLNDPRAAALTDNFVGQWLDLREIDFTSPDENLYPDFDELLRVSMVKETELFFQSVLREDLSLLNFVDSTFTFLNQRLAEHYQIEGVQGQAMRRVELPADSVRGGVITQASVLKVTANGTTTSPVLRGVWVLKKLLGQEVPPPPSSVSAVEPDIRGATTLREQLAKHRDSESCATCHRKIDPAGFALENFDVIGGWRDRYRTLGDGPRPKQSRDPHTFAWVRYRIGKPVDATGQTEDGKAFTDITQFKRLLLEDQRQLVHAMTEQLATYALGRRIGFSDRDSIDQIVDQVIAQQCGFRSLVHAITQHELFQQP
ncbi:DUF1592 domain-containing protein [Stieleria sp. TO1_6]|uniref:DUF1592 domain-containing protein n=1 Tax=Stieleria tagensis TaxID=2956795 RepID=UPI00209AED6A|nr:DUF1592 domain-containing protein [Stieleria tagensis]MCO8125024.1 DUF1592 domain-containing protein [Stieleria tagensis]